MKEIHDFCHQVYLSACKHELWRNASPQELDNVAESLEKFVLSKLYNRVFGASSVSQEIDIALSEKMASLQVTARVPYALSAFLTSCACLAVDSAAAS